LSKHYESEQLQSYALEQVQLISYENSSKNVSKRMGNCSISDMRLHGLVNEYAQDIKQRQEKQIALYENQTNQLLK